MKIWRLVKVGFKMVVQLLRKSVLVQDLGFCKLKHMYYRVGHPVT